MLRYKLRISLFLLLLPVFLLCSCSSQAVYNVGVKRSQAESNVATVTGQAILLNIGTLQPYVHVDDRKWPTVQVGSYGVGERKSTDLGTFVLRVAPGKHVLHFTFGVPLGVRGDYQFNSRMNAPVDVPFDAVAGRHYKLALSAGNLTAGYVAELKIGVALVEVETGKIYRRTKPGGQP